MLRVADLRAGYAGAPVLFGVDLRVDAGACVALLGRNGMGKTTTVRAITGLLAPTGGSIRFQGADTEPREIAGMPPWRVARLGLGLVPEGRQVFPTLSVRENLVATAADRRGDDTAGSWTEDAVYDLFPALAARRRAAGALLSGGEQQMVAIGRALMTNPRLLILDEATEGLAPMVRAEIWRCLARLKDDGLALLVIDKSVDSLTRLADAVFIIEKGRTVWSGTGAALAEASDVRQRHLGV